MGRCGSSLILRNQKRRGSRCRCRSATAGGRRRRSACASAAGSDQERKVAAEKAVLMATTAGGEGVRIVAPGRDEISKAPDTYIAGWPGVVNDCLDRIGRGGPPQTTARDCARAVTLVFDAYRM